MTSKWIAIMGITIFVTMMAGMAFEKHSKAEIKLACFQAQVEAAKQHVPFTTDCSK